MADAAPPKSRFLIPANEFILGPDASWLIEEILPERSFGLLYAQPGAYKSFIGLGLARSILTGSPFCGFSTHLQGSAIYVCLEGKGGATRRVRAITQTLSPEQQARFQVIKYPFRMPDTSRSDWLLLMNDLANFEKEHGHIRLVIIDTFARFSEVDENSSTQIGRMTVDLQQLIDATGATVLVIHHEGKTEGKGVRGSSALMGAADVVIRVDKLGDGFATITCDKQKDFDEFQPFTIELETVTLGDGLTTLRVKGRADAHAAHLSKKADDVAGVARPAFEKAKQEILTALATSPEGLRHKDLLAVVAKKDVKKRTFASALKDLEELGRISQTNGAWLIKSG